MVKILSTWLLNDPSRSTDVMMDKKLTKGTFNNHVDKILIIFDPLPPLGGQIWTFLTPFSYVQMDMWTFVNPLPPIHVQVVIERP